MSFRGSNEYLKSRSLNLKLHTAVTTDTRARQLVPLVRYLGEAQAIINLLAHYNLLQVQLHPRKRNLA